MAGDLPDFLVIGAMKAGTTYLQARLAAHVEIGVPGVKETDFFVPELAAGRDLAWYRAQFPRARLRGEISPNYTKAAIFPGVPERIAAVLPRVKLIYLMRDPVGRARSEYLHKRAAGLLRPGAALDPQAFARLVEAGLYDKQLAAFARVFSDAQILCLTAEGLRADPAATLSRIAALLGVADDWPQPLRHANAAVTRLPSWYWRLRETGPARFARRWAPGGAAERVRRAVMMRADPVYDAPDDLPERVRDASAADSARMRARWGVETPGWTC